MRAYVADFRVNGCSVVRIDGDDGRQLNQSDYFGNRAHAGAWVKGAQARIENKPRRSPYSDTPTKGNTMRSGRAGRYAFRNAWLVGWNAADKAIAQARETEGEVRK